MDTQNEFLLWASCGSSELLETLTAMRQVTKGRKFKAILQCVLLRSDGSLMVTDIDTQMIRLVFPWETVPSKDIAVNLEALLKICKACKRKSMLFLEKDGVLKVVSNGCEFMLETCDAEEFPSNYDTSGELVCTIKEGGLQSKLKAVSYATDSEASRYALFGVLFESSADRAWYVASDGRRLAYADSAIRFYRPTEMIFPTTFIRALYAADPFGDATLFQRWGEPIPQPEGDPKQNLLGACVYVSDWCIVTRLCEGRFPRWRDVISSSPATNHIGFLTEDLRNGIERLCLNEPRWIDFIGCVRGVALSTSYSKSLVPTADATGLDIRLDGDFVLEFLKNCGAKRVHIEWADGEHAATFSSDSHYCLIMPLSNGREKPEAEASE